MKIGISLSIDVTKIEKHRLYQGKKGTYLDATVFVDVDEADKYGNHGMIVQSVSKDEKQQGIQGPILGNCKVFWRDERGPAQGPAAGPADDFEDDDLPF